MELYVLSEARDEIGASPSAQDMIEMTRAAGLVGCRVFYIPKNFEHCETADNALWQIEAQPRPTPAVWLGFIEKGRKTSELVSDGYKPRRP